MTKWVKESRLVGPFLFPVDDSYRDTFNEFQLQTQRTVWVDWKQGAAVMWMSSFYWQWMPRFLEVKSLKTEGDFVNYAIKNKIPNIVFPLDVGDCRGGTKEVFKNAKYVICSVNSN